MSSVTPSSSKSHSKKAGCSRDKNKTLASESGGSSQCDTPPLLEKDGSSVQGKYAGIGADSVLCMSDQVGAEITPEAAANLAEDVSYKLRQIISNIALHSEMMKKTRLDDWDVNIGLVLSDTSPVVGASTIQYATFSDEKLCCPVEIIMNVTEIALTPQSYVYTTMPTISVEWITDEKSLNNNSNISFSLQNYYTKVAKAILNLRKKPKEVAVQDLTTNTRIGPIFPNLFNLAVLVLNDDNLNALNVPAKKPLQSNVLDMVDALCSNPCSLDTNIQQQFQRLFPVMVSNILGNGSLAEKMVLILTKITRTWPSFITIGKGILFDYLSQGTKERLTAPMIKCVLALGRQALIECLGDYLEYLDDCIQGPRRNNAQLDLRETILDVSTSLLRSEPTTFLEDFVMTDYTLYEMLGDSITPRRTIFPYCDPQNSENPKPERTVDEEFSCNSLRCSTRRLKLRCFAINKVLNPVHRDTIFGPTNFSIQKKNTQIRFRIKGCRNKEIPVRLTPWPQLSQKINHSYLSSQPNNITVAGGFLNRFRFKEWKPSDRFPIFVALTL